MIRPHIKICGLRTASIVETVLERGCREIGFVHFEPSPRHLTIDAMTRLRASVGGRAAVTVVMVDPDDATLARVVQRVRPETIQLHGRESAARVAAVGAQTGLAVMKAISIRTAEDLLAIPRYRAVADRILLDAKAPAGAALPGGNGVAFDWGLLDALGEDRDFLLSGGLNPGNIAAAWRRVHPRGFDVSSGVETAPGVKDAGLIHRLFDALESAMAADEAQGRSAGSGQAAIHRPGDDRAVNHGAGAERRASA